MVFTDGEENSSRHFTWTDVSSSIQHQQKVYSWEFIFLGGVRRGQTLLGLKLDHILPFLATEIVKASFRHTPSLFPVRILSTTLTDASVRMLCGGARI